MKKTFKHFFCLFVAILCFGQMWGTTQTIGFTTATCSKEATSGGERSLTNVTNLTVAHELVSTTSGALATYTKADKEVELSNSTAKGYSRGGYKWNVKTGSTLGTSNNTVGFSVEVGSGKQFTVDSISFAIGASANMVYQVIIYQGSDTLYKSSELTFTRGNSTANPNYSLTVRGLSAQSALQNLTGTFYVRARFAFNSTGKYFFLPAFTITGDLHDESSGDTPAVDVTAPTLSSSSPANSATGVAVSGTIVLTFSEDIASVDGSKFSLSGATIGTVAIDGTDAKKVNIPYSGASNSATVTLSVAADAVADAAGNKSAALSDISFTTVAAGYSVTHSLTNVTKKSGATGAGAATIGSDYDAVFAVTEHKVGYTLPETIGVTIGGETATSGTDYNWNASTGAFQVPAAKVTGNIVVTVSAVVPTKTTKSSYTDFTQESTTNAYYTYLTQTNYNSYATAGWMVVADGVDSKTASKKLTIDPATDETITGESKTYGSIKQLSDNGRYMEFYLTGISSAKFYFLNGGSDSRTVQYKLNGGDATNLVEVTNGTCNSGTINNLDPEEEYTIRIGATGDLYVCAMKVTLPVAPAITSPTSTPDVAVYTVGDETTALSVTATGTPTPTYQWYSNSSASTSGATTLTNCTTATYTPSSADVSDLYYYCVATNVAGSATSVFFHVKVNAPALPTHSITYDNLKGQSVSSYPTEYYEGVGVASFDPLADVAGFHFTGWSPASIATTATTDQTITAQWTPTYSVTYNLNGATSGTLPTETAKYEDQEFTLAAQGDIVAPTGKKFLGWKDQNGNKYDAEANYTMPGKAVTLTAYWALKMEDVIYSWEGGSEGATEVGGTAVTKAEDGTDAETSDINVDAVGTNATYKSIKLQGSISSNKWSKNYIQITTDKAVKAGDKVKVTACTTKGDATKKGSAQMRAGASATSTAIFTDGGSYNDIVADGTLSPNTKTFTIPDGVNTSTLTMTRSQAGTNCWVTRLQIIRESYVDEDDLLTVTFNYNDGGATTSTTVKVVSGATVSAPADPTWAHHRFHEWQLSGSAYNFSTAVTSNITLVANWTQLYTITYAAGDGSGDAPEAVDDKAATETFTVAANTFTAPEGKEFDKWNDGTKDYAPGATYTVGTANVTLTAQWRTPVPKYTVTYNLGGASGDAPTLEDQAAGDGFSLASAPSRDGYVFRGWKCDIDDVLYAAGASYTMTAAATTFTAIWKRDAYTLLHWRADAGTTTTDATNGTTTGGTVTLRSTDTNTWGTESVTYNASVASNMKATSTNEMKAGKNAVYLELNLTSGTFQAEDTIYVTGYNPWGFSTSSSFTSLDVDSVVTGATGKGDVKTGYGIIKDGVDASTIYVRRGTGSGSGIAAIKIIRPVERIVMGTEIALYAVFINDVTISASDLSTLQSTHKLDLSNAYVNAPTVKFIERTTVTYDEGDPKITDREISVTASENSAGKWEATATINTIDYTVTMAIPTDPKLETETTTLALDSKTNHSDSKTFTFSGMNLEHNVTIGLALSVAGITISPTEVAPNEDGAITNQEVTVSYTSMADVAATNVVLTVYYSESVKKEITLTYSSTKGYTAITDVTSDITWDFSKTGSTSLQNQTDVILANMPGVTNDENFNSEALYGTFNKLKGDGNSYQGSVLKFHTTVPGEVTVNFSGTNTNARKLQVIDNTGTVAEWTYNSSSEKLTKTIAVQPGDVYLKAFEGETANNARIYWLKFELKNPDYTRSLTAGRFGTICLPNGGTIEGAAIYEIVYKEASQIFFDEVDGGVMIAGRPYIFYPYSGSTELKVYYTDNLSADAGNHNGLYGSYSETVLEPNDGNYILYNNMYYLVNSTASVGANRAYIKLGEVPNQPQAPVPGRRRISMQVQGEQIATGIIDAENAEQPMKVMIDNKLYIIREGQMYDMTGSKVK